jgi:S-(hydroxymethyl)glutathione dehydrogenase/alcohol dehydrogenase
MTTPASVRDRKAQATVTQARRIMKAAILVQQHAPLVVADDVEIPDVGVGQVLVQVKASGICGKQLEEISGRRGADPFLPHLLGHEGAGVVVEVGPGVRKVKRGDHVVLHWMKGSGIDSATPAFRRNGTVVNAGWVTTFSEYTIASENRLTPMVPDVPFDLACLLGCAVTTGLGIVLNNAALKPGQSIAVFGVGGIGLNVLHGAGLVNAYPIVAVDLYEHKLQQALAFGATHTVNAAHREAQSRLKELAGGRGFEVTVDATGNADTRQMAYDLTSHTGLTILAGVPHYQERIAIDSFPLHFGRRIVGSHGGDARPDVDIPRYLQLYKLGKLKLEEQITHRFPLDDVNTAIDVVRSGRAGRCIMVMR